MTGKIYHFKNMSTELTATEEVLPEKFGIEPKKAVELMGNLPLIKQQREELIAKFNEVIKLDIEDPATAKIAQELKQEIVKNRTQGIEKWHKESKDVFLRGGQFVDAIKRSESSINTTMEDELSKIVKHRENLEKERIEGIRQARLAELSEFNSPEIPGLGEMADSVYSAYLTGVKVKFEADQKAEQERLEAERIQNLHNERYTRLAKYADHIPDFENLNFGKISEEDFIKVGTDAKAKKDKADADNARIQAENERLQKERDEAEKKAKDEAEKARKDAEDKAKAEADRIKADADAKLREEQAEKQKAIDEANRLKEAEQARIDTQNKAEADKKAEEARIAKQGENKRLLDWIESFELPNIPGGGYTKDGTARIAEIQSQFDKFKTWAKKSCTKQE